MKKIVTAFFVLLAVMLQVFVPVATVSAGPVDVFNGACSGSSSSLCKDSGSGLFSVIKSVVQVLLIVGGIIAVIMIIVGGIRFMTSNGDQGKIKSAKDTVLYAIIGLVVTLAAFAIVTWVVGKF